MSRQNTQYWWKMALVGVLGAGLALAGPPSGNAAKKVVKPKSPVTKKKAIPTIPGPAAVAPTAAPALVPTLAWTKCGVYQCASLQVPQDYRNPGAGMITVALEKIPATQRVGSILINPGGPGGSGINFLHRDATKIFNADVTRSYDVIGFDPRGVGKSTPIPCGSAQNRGARTSKEYVLSVADACLRRAPALVAAITTENTARDMEEIRKALGEPKLNYLGISYGTYLGQVYADLFPTTVGRFVLDSVVDANLRALAMNVAQQAQYEANVRKLMASCTGACPFVDPDTYGRLQRLLNKLDKNPIFARNVAYGGTRGNLEILLRVLPIRQGGSDLMLRALLEWEKGDPSSIMGAVALLDDVLPDPADLDDSVDEAGVYYAVACSEGFHPSASPDYNTFADQLKAVAPSFVKTAESRAGVPTCEWWGKRNETRPIPRAKPGVPPMLFIGASDDTTTPFAWTENVSKFWPGSGLLKVSSGWHGVTTRSTCAAKAADDFFVSGALPAPGTTCPS